MAEPFAFYAYGSALNTNLILAAREKVGVHAWMHPAQYASYVDTKDSRGKSPYLMNSFGGIPVIINPTMPKDEVRITDLDGVELVVIRNLAVPAGY